MTMQWQHKQIKQRELKETNMDFIRAIQNDIDIVTDEEVDKFLEELSTLDDIELLDEDAFDRIATRVDARDLAMYRFLVGGSNLMQAKLFIEYAKKGKSIPSAYVRGFLPALEILDDIVTAGPGYVQMLKVLAKRARNIRKN
jgi:hypothetical protein